MGQIELTKLTNKQLIESAFKQIEDETGFHIINKQYGDSYFVFEDETDSICHFKIKEISGFKFAFWNICRFDKIEDQLAKQGPGYTWADNLHISPRSELIFFTQYERDLDKFKPSRSGFVHGIYRDAWIERDNDEEDDRQVEEWYMDDLIASLIYIKNHHLKAIVHAGAQNRYLWEEISFFKALKVYIKSTYYDYKYKFRNNLDLQKTIKLSKKLVKKLKYSNAYIIDRGCCFHPRIDIVIRRNNSATTEKLVTENKIVEDFIHKYYMTASISYMEAYDIINESTPSKLEIYKDLKLEKQFLDNIEKLNNNTFFDEDDINDGAKLIGIKID